MQVDDDNKESKESGDAEPYRGITDWFARQNDAMKRLGALQHRFEHPDGTPTKSLLSELDTLVDEVKQGGASMSDEMARFRNNRPQNEQEREQRREALKDVQSNVMATLKSFMDTMNQPSPLDLSGAICEGDLAEVRRLLDAGVDPNALNSSGDTMLKLSLVFRHKDIATLLRERGASYGIIEAALAGDADAVVRFLGADDAGENAPKHKIDAALKYAVGKGHMDVVQLLLARGADPNYLDKNHYSPLASACVEGFPEIARLLVDAGAHVGIVEAAYLGDVALLTRLLDAGDSVETTNAAHTTPLVAATDCGHVEVVRFLLERGADPHRESQTGRTALVAAVVRERLPIIRLLIDHGADPNAVCGRFGSTPLSSAVTFGKLRSVETLLARGADPNTPTRDNITPLLKCARCSASILQKHDTMLRIASLLLDAGADIEAREDSQFTPLMRAAKSGDGEMVRLLLARGASVNVASDSGYFTPLSLARSKDGPKDRRDKTLTRTLIMEAMGQEYAVYDAAERGDAERIAALIAAGAPVDQGIVFDKRMLDGGVIKAEDMEEAPLMAAAGNGHAEVVALLLTQEGISTRSKNSALFAAEYDHHEEAARLLREVGAVNEIGVRRDG